VRNIGRWRLWRGFIILCDEGVTGTVGDGRRDWVDEIVTFEVKLGVKYGLGTALASVTGGIYMLTLRG